MDDLLMVMGILLLFVGFPVSIITTIVFAVKKKKIKIPAIWIMVSFFLSIIFLVIGSTLYSRTDEYKEYLAKKEAEEERELEEKNIEVEKEEIEEIEEKETDVFKEDIKESEVNKNEEEVNEPEYDKEEVESNNTENEEVERTDTVKEDTNEFLSDLKKELDEKVAEKAYDILKNQIGFSNLEYNKKMEGLTNYEILADGYQVIMTASDDVYRIFIPNSHYTFYEDGEVKFTAYELGQKSISYDDMYSYYIMAQEIVSSCLKDPGSADFPSMVTNPEEIAMQKNGDVIAVQSYVDAKNSFNAKVRSKWTVQFKVIDLSSYSYETLYINIDGEESGNFVEMD